MIGVARPGANVSGSLTNVGRLLRVTATNTYGEATVSESAGALTGVTTLTASGAIAGLSLTASSLTSGRLLLAGTAGLITDDSALVWDSTNDSLGIGTAATSTTQIKTAKTFTSTSAVYGIDHRPIWAPSSTSSSQAHGSQLRFDCNATAGAITAPASTPNSAVMCQAVCAAGNVTAMAGFSCEVYNLGSGTLGSAIAVHARTAQNTGGGALTTAIGLRVESQTAGTNRYGVDIANISGGTSNFALRTGTGAVSLGDTTASTSTTTGALIVAGGLGVAGAGFFGGVVTVPNGTSAAPGLRLTSEQTGLYRVSSTSLGFAVAGTAAASLNSAGAFACTTLTLTGTVAAGDALGSTHTFTALNGQSYNFFPTWGFSADSSNRTRGLRVTARTASASTFNLTNATQGDNCAVSFDFIHQGTGTITDLNVATFTAFNNSTGTITTLRGAQIIMSTNAGTINNYTGLEIAASATGTATNYGLRIGNISGGSDPRALVIGSGRSTFADTTASSSTTTGAITVAGGLGVAGASYFGATTTNVQNTNGSAVAFVASNTNAGTTAETRSNYINDSSNGIAIRSFSSGYSGSVFGLTAAHLAAVTTSGSGTTAMVVGPGVNVPLVFITNSVERARFSGSAFALASGGTVTINSVQVVGPQGAAVADATGGATVDAEARTAINALLARLRTHGLIAT